MDETEPTTTGPDAPNGKAGTGSSGSGSGSGKGSAIPTGKGGNVTGKGSNAGKGGGPQLTGADIEQLARQIELVTTRTVSTPPPISSGPKVSGELLAGIGVGLAAIIVGVIVVVGGGGGGDKQTTSTDASVADATVPAATTPTTEAAVTSTSAAATTTSEATTTTTVVAEPTIPAGTTLTLTMVSTDAHNGRAPVHNETNGQTVLGETRTATLTFDEPCTPEHCVGAYADDWPTGIYGVYGLSWGLFGAGAPVPFTFADGAYSATASGQVSCGGNLRDDGLSKTLGTISWTFTMLDQQDAAAGTPLIQGVVSTSFADEFTFRDYGPELQNHEYCENTWGTLEFTGAAVG